MRFGLFFAVVLLLLTAMHLYVFRRMSRALVLGPRARRALAAVLVAGLVATVLGRVLASVVPAALAEWLGVVGSVLAISVLLTFLLLGIEGLVRGLAGGVRRLASKPAPALAPPEEPPLPATELPRRDLLSAAVAGGAAVLGTSTSVYAAAVGRRDYTVEEVPIKLAKLPKELDGFTLVQLSDIHVGTFVGEEELAAALDLVTAARPDLIVLTGDLVDHDPRYADMLGAFTRRLCERAPVTAIMGNHDYYAGQRVVRSALDRAGAEVLINASRTIDRRLVLAGVDDVRGVSYRAGGGPDLVTALAGTDPELPRVLLCHNPVYFPEASGHVDLQLSGHTHGGQFSPLINPASLVLGHGYIRGLYQRGASQIYVNRGFGTAGPPLRIGSAPEVTKIVLCA